MARSLDEIIPATRDMERPVLLLPDSEPCALYCPIISGDDHVRELANPFERLPRRF